jgi:hypothetical protein
VIYLWRYHENRRNYPGFHLTADAQGCALLIAALEVSSTTTIDRTNRFELSRATSSVLSVPNNRGGTATFSSYSEWVIECGAKLADGHQCFEITGSRCRLLVSPRRSAEILSGVMAIADGRGDYCIGDDDHELWFWWHPKISKAAKRR